MRSGSVDFEVMVADVAAAMRAALAHRRDEIVALAILLVVG